MGQLRSVIDTLSTVRDLRSEFRAKLKEQPGEMREELLAPPFEWATAYELPFEQCLAALILVAGEKPALLRCVKARDPQQAFLDWMEADSASWKADAQTEYSKKQFLGLLECIVNTLESLVVYGRSINHLVEDVRNGNDESLFKALRIDRAVLGCPRVANRLCRASLEGDEGFFKKLRNALTGPQKKIHRDYDELRLALALLRDAGALDSLTEETSYQLLCVELRLYPLDGEDPARSLNRFIQRWRKEVAT